MENAASSWARRLTLRKSMHDAWLHRPGLPYPWPDSLRVSWKDDVYTFTLVVNHYMVSGDHCFAANASAVFDAYAVQLAGGDVPTR
jgi:hypothetical protein